MDKERKKFYKIADEFRKEIEEYIEGYDDNYDDCSDTFCEEDDEYRDELAAMLENIRKQFIGVIWEIEQEKLKEMRGENE